MVRRVGGLAAGVNHFLKKSILSFSFNVGVGGSEAVDGVAGKTGNAGITLVGLSGTFVPYSDSAAVVVVDDRLRPDILPVPNLNFPVLIVPFLFMLENNLLFFLPSAAASERMDSAITE